MAKKATEKNRNGTGNGVVRAPDAYEQLIEQGQARSIGLQDIEKGITQLWQAAGKTRDGDEEPAVMRACVLNLIIFTSSDEELEAVTKTIARLTWTFPSRAIVLLSKSEIQGDEMNAWISAHCQAPDPKGHKVCCEQITVEAHGTATERLGSMVLPLLVADLPVVLWWVGSPPMDSSLFRFLIDTSDRIILDSTDFDKPAQTFQHLAELARSQRGNTRFSDLNWSRLTTWRSLIAQMFDAPENLAFLNHIDRMEIEYEAPDDNEQPNFSEALLLVGWLAKLLNWQPAFALKHKGQTASLILDQNGQPLNIEFHGHNDRKDDLGGLTCVRIFASLPEENREAVFTVSLGDDYEHVNCTAEVNGERSSTRTALMVHRDVTDLLHEELSYVGRDSLYEGSLNIAGKFASS